MTNQVRNSTMRRRASCRRGRACRWRRALERLETLQRRLSCLPAFRTRCRGRYGRETPEPPLQFFHGTVEIRHAPGATVENGEIEPTFGPAMRGLEGGFELAFGGSRVFAFF